MKVNKKEPTLNAALFITIWLCYAVFFTPAGGVTPNRYLNLTHSIVNKGTFAIDTYHENTIDKAYYDGHYYAGAMPGPSFLAVPSYYIFKLVYVNLIPTMFKKDFSKVSSFKKEKLKNSSFYGEVDNVEYFVSQGFIVIFCLAAFSAFGVILIKIIVEELGFGVKESLLVATVFGFGTIFFWHATTFFEQNFNVVLGLLTMYSVIKLTKADANSYWALLAGLSSGFCVLMEPSGVFIPAVWLAYMLGLRRVGPALRFIIGAAVPATILLLYNYILFDTPFTTPYQHLAGTEYLNITSEGLAGITHPRLDRFIGLLISPERGMLVYYPIAIFGLAGIFICLKREKRFQGICIAMIAIFLISHLFVSSFRGWDAGGAFGPRYAMFGLPSVIIPLAYYLRYSKERFVFVAAAIISVVINLSGAMRGFAENYYQPVVELISMGPTLPWVESIRTHAVTGGGGVGMIMELGSYIAGALIIVTMGTYIIVVCKVWRISD